CYEECVIDSYYDSLVGKLIVHGRSRGEAISRMRSALEMFIVEGVQTSLPLHEKIVAEPDFIEGNYHVGFLERYAQQPQQSGKETPVESAGPVHALQPHKAS